MSLPLTVLRKRVVEGGYCIGCGVCALAAPPGTVTMGVDEFGRIQSRVDDRPGGDGGAAALAACPFGPDGPDEDELATQRFGNALSHHHEVGRHRAVYAARVTDGALWSRSSSGGVARWLLHRLLSNGIVDGVVHVRALRADRPDAPLYDYAIATDPAEVLETARSAYYPVTMADALASVRDRPGRYVLTGVPCFVKAVRRLALVDPVIRERIRFCVGIICGHLKSRHYAEMIAWQLGVPPERLAALDFRVKIPGKRANEKGVAAWSIDDPARTFGPRTVQETFGTNYAHGFFKYPACDACDDVLAETADVAIGDAWLPEYLDRGTSLVVVRDGELAELIRQGGVDGELELEPISVERAAASQRGGLRHRRQDLQYRLHRWRESKTWHPPKRVQPSDSHIDGVRKEIVDARLALRDRSAEEFLKARTAGDLDRFVRAMAPLVRRYNNLGVPAWRRLVRTLVDLLGVRPALGRLARRLRGP